MCDPHFTFGQCLRVTQTSQPRLGADWALDSSNCWNQYALLSLVDVSGNHYLIYLLIPSRGRKRSHLARLCRIRRGRLLPPAGPGEVSFAGLPGGAALLRRLRPQDGVRHPPGSRSTSAPRPLQRVGASRQRAKQTTTPCFWRLLLRSVRSALRNGSIPASRVGFLGNPRFPGFWKHRDWGGMVGAGPLGMAPKG